MGIRRFAICWGFIFAASMAIRVATAQRSLPDAPKPKIKTTQPSRPAESSWPRPFTSGGSTFMVYQPQVDKWNENLADFYCAVELKTGKESAPKYGVVWLQARTEVDKVNRLVTLDQAKITKVKFPSAPDKEPELTALLGKKLPGATKTISLDRLEAALELDGDAVKGVGVKNDPPKVIIATKPSMLVLIDGKTQVGDVPGTTLRSVINTRSTILYDSDKELYFLRVQDWWMQAKELEGRWEYAKKLPESIKEAEEIIAKQNEGQNNEGGQTQQQPSLKKPGEKPKDAEIPVVYVAFEPTEMIETKGDSKYDSIPGTTLKYVANTNGNIFRIEDGDYYILISGRWFKSKTLDGPWSFVTAADMPPDFAKIAKDNAKSMVLASVPGTPEAKEALIANSIPQTATITRAEAKLTVQYDGEPMFIPIDGTSLSYAKNTSAAVIKVSDNDYYCVEAGVWFKAPTPQGPWNVADSVPEVIYTIPP